MGLVRDARRQGGQESLEGCRDQEADRKRKPQLTFANRVDPARWRRAGDAETDPATSTTTTTVNRADLSDSELNAHAIRRADACAPPRRRRDERESPRRIEIEIWRVQTMKTARGRSRHRVWTRYRRQRPATCARISHCKCARATIIGPAYRAVAVALEGAEGL